MRILIDIGHPAHIHYFKNCVDILSKRGFEFLFTVRERDSTIELIESQGYKYVSRGKGGHNLMTKLLDIPLIDYKIYKIAHSFKPDLFVSFSSFYAAHVAWIMRKPHIAFDDTEHAVFEHILCRPFTNVVLSPSCYFAKLSKNQMLFNSYMELCYLHPNYFTPDISIKKVLGIGDNEKYCVLRFVSWDANHDVGQHGLTIENKISLVNELSKYCRVFISSEQKLPNALEEYRLHIHPSMLHNVLSFANLYIGEGSTTASESAILGTPAIYINSLKVGYCEEEDSKYQLLYHFYNYEGIIEKAVQIISDINSDILYSTRRNELLKDKIDPTPFMVWFIENYPESNRIMKENPDYQNNFK